MNAGTSKANQESSNISFLTGTVTPIAKLHIYFKKITKP